ncbi:HIT family protein [Akkermansiaceae bacterium]|nr:HIT family protein [Akkermansiaceae bacterium]
MSFTLHPRLEAGTHLLGIRDNCLVLLKNNATFPWLLIVPQVDEAIEDLHQLSPQHYGETCFLIRSVSQFVSGYFLPEKLNVACLGNVVRQMHIHVVGRSETDPAWPGTVWASDDKSDYSDERIAEIRHAARTYLGLS